MIECGKDKIHVEGTQMILLAELETIIKTVKIVAEVTDTTIINRVKHALEEER